MQYDALELSKILLTEKTVTPVKEEGFKRLKLLLEDLGFNCQIMNFSDSTNTPDVANLFAKIGNSEPNICFAGHLDVVSPGDLNSWDNDPFLPIIKDNMLIARGTSDMKCAIAAFISAFATYKSKHGFNQGSVSLLITGDEEGPSINGTKKMLEKLSEQKEKFSACIVGEPTAVTNVGDTIKIGRRGSISFYIKITGKQGHVAYPQLAKNPIPALNELLKSLSSLTLDQGNQFFQASNLEIVSLKSGGNGDNIIPETAEATVNIRFNNIHSSITLMELVASYAENIKEKFAVNCHISHHISGEAFISNPGNFSDLVIDAITEVTKKKPDISTSGGTSDARFIKDYCPVIELGLQNATAHKINEQVAIDDIYTLSKIYENILLKFFA